MPASCPRWRRWCGGAACFTGDGARRATSPRGRAPWRASRARVEKALSSLGTVIPIRLGGRPHPDDATVAKVMAAGKLAGSYIAVGSGTINDLAKFAAAKQRKRCAVFATAPFDELNDQ